MGSGGPTQGMDRKKGRGVGMRACEDFPTKLSTVGRRAFFFGVFFSGSTSAVLVTFRFLLGYTGTHHST